MDSISVEVKAKYKNGQVYFEEMPSLKEQEFEFVAQIPKKYVENKKQDKIASLEHLPTDFAQKILEQMARERNEYEQITQMAIATDVPELSEKQKQSMEAFALYNRCK